MRSPTPSAWRRFIVQFDVSHNAIVLAFFAFTAMLQNMSARLDIIPIPVAIPSVFFTLSVIILTVCLTITSIRCFLFPRAIVSDFEHARLSNFFFLPCIVGALALLTAPPSLRSLTAFRVGFYMLSTYQVALALYLFGEWLFAAAPTRSIYPLYFMQTIGFFLLSIVASTARLPDLAFFMLSVGILFWLLILVTTFQHVSHVLGKQAELPQPAFFLFIAPPAQAAIAFVMLDAAEASSGSGLLQAVGPLPWSRIAEWFLYVDLFLYLLMVRLFPTWWKETFKVSWWAYVFPLSGAATAVILRYESEKLLFWGILAVVLAVLAGMAMTVVFCFTVWALAMGKLPKNEACLTAYEQYYAERFADAEGDIDAMEGSVDAMERGVDATERSVEAVRVDGEADADEPGR